MDTALQTLGQPPVLRATRDAVHLQPPLSQRPANTVRASKRPRKKRTALQALRIATINVRSILCDDDPGVSTTARSQLLKRELIEKDLQIAFVQETKLHARYVVDNDDFWILAASPHERVGGLQTHVAKGAGLSVLWTYELCPRVLATGIKWGAESWCLINAYSPTSVSPDEDFQAFWQSMTAAFRLARKNGMLVLCGADLNNKFGGAQDGLRVGPAVIGCALSDTQWRVNMIVASLVEFGLSAWSTMVGLPHTTWTSPHGTESQIDYTLGDVNRLNRVGAGGTREFELFPTDHRIVWLTLFPTDDAGSASLTSSARHKPLRLRGPDHELAVKLALTNMDHLSWSREEDPVIAMNKCLKMVRGVIMKAPGNEVAVRQSWVGELAWKEIRFGATIRRFLCRSLRRAQRMSKMWAWKCLENNVRGELLEMADGPSCCMQRWRCLTLQWVLAKVAYRAQHKKVQKLVRADKKAWLANKMKELHRLTSEGTSSTLHRQVKSCLTRINCSRAATTRAPLQDMNDRWHITEDEKAIVWQQHWCQLYGGKMTTHEQSFKHCSMPKRAVDVYLQPTQSDLFSEAEVRSALKHQMNGKAAADGLPTKVSSHTRPARSNLDEGI
eukprot:5519869-Amphidinium_carterae.2